MTLIGNCQSAKAFCTQNRKTCSSENRFDKISNEEAKQLLQDFNHYISNYKKILNKNFLSLNEEFEIQFSTFSGEFSSLNEISFILNIHKITSKVRNKDYLEDFVLS